MLAQKILEKKPRGIILTGGPSSCYEEGAATCSPELFEQGIPVLGLCYGAEVNDRCQFLFHTSSFAPAHVFLYVSLFIASHYRIDPRTSQACGAIASLWKELTGRIHPGAIVLLHSTSKTNGEIMDELLTKWEEATSSISFWKDALSDILDMSGW